MREIVTVALHTIYPICNCVYVHRYKHTEGKLNNKNSKINRYIVCICVFMSKTNADRVNFAPTFRSNQPTCTNTLAFRANKYRPFFFRLLKTNRMNSDGFFFGVFVFFFRFHFLLLLLRFLALFRFYDFDLLLFCAFFLMPSFFPLT